MPIIATSAAVQCCSKEMRSKARIIDRVIITGSTEPMFLYSIDLDERKVLAVEREPPPMKWNMRSRFIVRQWLDKKKDEIVSDDSTIIQYWDEDKDIVTMRKTYSESFFRSYMMGFQNYRSGEWRVATERFKHTLNMLGFEDGPSRRLLEFMERFSTVTCECGAALKEDAKFCKQCGRKKPDRLEIAAPKNWQGHHRLETALLAK